jgi:hypothetical protein
MSSPQDAKDEVARMMATDGRPGILFMDSQHRVSAWVPIDPASMERMKGTGQFDRLINSAAEAGAGAAIVANPGGALSRQALGNIASALNLADVRTLDVIDAKAGTSAAERSDMPGINLPILSATGGIAIPGGIKAPDLRKVVKAATEQWETGPGMPRVRVVATATDLPSDVQVLLHDMNALDSTRGLMLPDGRVFLVADRINNAAEGQAILFHETYGHFGLRAFLGDSYEIQMGLLRMANPKLAAEANGWYAMHGQHQINARITSGMTRAEAEATVRALAVEEALADRAGSAPAPKGWKLLMARLQKALRTMGLDSVANMLERMTEAETHALLMNARTMVVGPHANRTGVSLAGGQAVANSKAARSARKIAVHGDVPQSVHSEMTSRKQVPASMRKIDWVPGTTNADIGSGRFSDATEFLRAKGVLNLEFDPYNLEEVQNYMSVSSLSDEQADTATVFNVLNVIPEAQARGNTIRRAAKAIKDDGVAYFQIYEGDGSGVPGKTRDGWQENRKADTYLEEIAQHFNDVQRHGGVIEARNPIRQAGDSWMASDGGILFSKTQAQGRIRRTINEMVGMADDQEQWKDWYDHHKATVEELFGDDATMFQKILSGTSQMQTVKGNVTMALRAYELMVTGRPFVGFLPAVAKNLDRIRNDLTLNGPKIGEFERGNLGAEDAIAVDRHIAQLLFNTSTPSRLRSTSTRPSPRS